MGHRKGNFYIRILLFFIPEVIPMKVMKTRMLSTVIMGAVLLFVLSTLIFPGVNAYDTDEGNESVSAGSPWSYSIGLEDGGGLSYTIDDINGGTVNVLLMDSYNYARYISGQDFDAIEADYEISWSASNSMTMEPGTYYLVVETNDSSDVSFHYSLKYGEDYTPSFWESFLAGGLLGGTMCIIGLVVFIIWLYVLVWVYKDAKRRGKSGGLWLLIVLIFGIIGLIVWLVIRPPLQQQAPYQQPYQAVPPQQPYQQYPPQYQAQQPPQQTVPSMPYRCPNCGMQVDPNWNTCPNCGARLR